MIENLRYYKQKEILKMFGLSRYLFIKGIKEGLFPEPSVQMGHHKRWDYAQIEDINKVIPRVDQ